MIRSLLDNILTIIRYESVEVIDNLMEYIRSGGSLAEINFCVETLLGLSAATTDKASREN